jgi:hypothetical protein
MLACGQPVAFVASLFGPAVLRRKHDEGWIEHVFHTPHALVQILADESAVTRRWSITVTDERFPFRVRDLTFGRTDLRLGRSRFWNLTEEEGGQLRGIAARGSTYTEAYEFGDLAANQVYLFAYNDCGIGDFDRQALQDSDLMNLAVGVFAHDSVAGQVQLIERLRSFRTSTTVNTLTVIGAIGEHSLATMLPYGVDLQHVRVFRPAAPLR